MGELRLDTLTMPAAAMGPTSYLPALQPPGRERFARADVAEVVAQSGERTRPPPDLNDPAVRYGGIYAPPDCLPYAVLDDFDRDRRPRAFRTAVLENAFLKATFTLELAGRLWSLEHKPTGRRLVAPNIVFQPTALSRRGAWISGGAEWNATPGGHTPQTVDPLFAAALQTDDGEPVLRLYEWERIGQIAYQIDCWLPDGSPFLYARVRLTNPHDRTIPMYWWTNITADEREDCRVIVPATEAMSWGYSGAARNVPIPVIGPRDVSRPTDLHGCCDFYYRIPDGQRPWIAYLDREGKGLVHASTARLFGRKLFVWGMNPGGRHWQEFLSPGGPPYVELQAGLMQTQYTSNVMPARAEWAWIEAFGLLEADADVVHGDDWPAAFGEAGARLDDALPQDRLEALLTATEAMANRPPDEILQRGSGWGAVERRRRQAAGERPPWPPSLVFDDDSLTDEQAPWIQLLDTGAMPDPTDGAAPRSFQIHDGWRQLLERAVERPCKENWAAWLHLGVLRYADDLAPADPDGAEAAWRRSLELRETPWAHRNLAVAAWHAGRRDDAVDRWLRAWRLRPDDVRLARECAKGLIRTGRHEAFFAMLAELPEILRADARMQIFRIICLLERGDAAAWDEVASFLARPAEPVDMQEGEPTFSNLFYEFEARRLATSEGAEVGEEHRRRVRDTLAVPPHLDFRQARDPALNAPADDADDG